MVLFPLVGIYIMRLVYLEEMNEDLVVAVQCEVRRAAYK